MEGNRRRNAVKAAIYTLFATMNRSLDRLPRDEERALEQPRIRLPARAEPQCKSHDPVCVVEEILGKARGKLRGAFRKVAVPPNKAACQSLVEQASADTRFHGHLQA
jgi:hypothetical protein